MAPEAVGRPPYYLPRSQSAWLAGPRLVRRFATSSDYQLGNWLVLPCRPQHLPLRGYLPCPGVHATRPSQTVLSGTQGAHWQWPLRPKLPAHATTGRASAAGRYSLMVVYTNGCAPCCCTDLTLSPRGHGQLPQSTVYRTLVRNELGLCNRTGTAGMQ